MQNRNPGRSHGIAADAVAAEQANRAARSPRDPLALQRELKEELLRSPEFRSDAVEAVGTDDAAPQRAVPLKSRLRARLLKAAVGLAVVAVFGALPLRALLQASSVEAIVNARVITVRAPIEGLVTGTHAGLSVAEVIGQSEVLLNIVNSRADRMRLDGLRDRLAQAEIERAALEAKLGSAQQAHDDIAEELARFTRGRVIQLEARAAELQAEVAAAKAQRDVAQAAAGRALALSRSGTVAAAELERLDRESTIAEQTVLSAERRLERVRVELDAVRAGTFVGDSYNDRPSSAQRRDELRQRIADLSADLGATRAEIRQLQQQLHEEAARYETFAHAAVSLPVDGRIWEVLTAPGEHVRVGQDLLRVLDCSGAVVTANVTESVYNRLSVGAAARFRPADGDAELRGIVTNLTGLAEAPANLAIEPSALGREAYRVTVHVPGLAQGNDCAVGRTGRVIFEAGARADVP
jgi:multidrug resistance efflux pump